MRNNIGKTIVNFKNLKIYDILESSMTTNTPLAIVSNVRDMLSVEVVDWDGVSNRDGCYTNSKYKPIASNTYLRYPGLQYSYKLVKRNYGIRPTLEQVKEDYEQFKLKQNDTKRSSSK